MYAFFLHILHAEYVQTFVFSQDSVGCSVALGQKQRFLYLKPPSWLSTVKSNFPQRTSKALRLYRAPERKVSFLRFFWVLIKILNHKYTFWGRYTSNIQTKWQPCNTTKGLWPLLSKTTHPRINLLMINKYLTIFPCNLQRF